MTSQEQLQKVNMKFKSVEDSLTKYLMDTRELNSDQCYIVTQFPIKCFSTKSKLENYLKTLSPSYKYQKLSELVFHLIQNEIIFDVSMTKLTKQTIKLL